ncbi:MAG: membrane protein insertion efficiency factor YidD [Candidatus Woykebacteria bacterium RIFCSPHIGHO2_12_FULL_43_10]|uniref:Putative membrane protein insertion efficiency factor n=1 Tax=Candidatus Woykebacteria bacterium RIFCSPHIGHO2_02_FULL_43_16b TaxID=1802601 RepID=A0A1G1WLQ7_9BACT|nr:MAG: membrane protein insertion efficiency factor YidD [Candidatus Woykebacteria bacterium RIFCSPHIGHO2_01_FULL_43_29]OGY28320.1 MAG: membrane protein insertion efficiency factor YidD [Candidatus Woykebacteria bacterium RIFCSPHIGHO2_02_FULL_43_16b]OGY28883.1 MAG: membrane protein insertion efficiency factor YidD [Candidatus Woykebacteria bacterium RIFCSPHIGHO2_12_FULL_43_10]
MKYLLLKLIKIYQILPKNPTCRYNPSCSEYSYQAVNKYGIIRGTQLSLKRLLSCHPFNNGGYDPLT